MFYFEFLIVLHDQLENKMANDTKKMIGKIKGIFWLIGSLGWKILKSSSK